MKITHLWNYHHPVGASHIYLVGHLQGFQGAKSSRHPRCPHSTPPLSSPLAEGTLGRCPLGWDPSRRQRGAQAAPAADRLFRGGLGTVNKNHGKNMENTWKVEKTMENTRKVEKTMEKHMESSGCIGDFVWLRLNGLCWWWDSRVSLSRP